MKPTSIRTIVSLLAILALVLHLTKSVVFSWEALVLVAIALLPWLSEFIESFSFGKDSFAVKLKEIEAKADAAMDAGLRGVAKADAAMDAGIRGVAKKPAVHHEANEAAAQPAGDDPQKGRWGGKAIANHRKLSAKIQKVPNENFFRRVILRVESTDPAKPLTGNVTFHLHPTFDDPEYDEPVVNGVAETSLISYGVFTVGAVADDGETKLELDLFELNDGKDQFFKR